MKRAARRDRTPSAAGGRRARRFGFFGLGAALAIAIGWTVALFGPAPVEAEEVTVYKSPWCECCGGWVEHMEASGFDVTVREVEDLDPVRAEHGVTDELMSCHTAVVDGYVVEGHVPAADVRRLLEERPDAKGLTAPGMPGGSPGMESAPKEPYAVLLFDADGDTQVFSRH